MDIDFYLNSILDSIWMTAEDAYLVGEIYVL